MATAALLLFAPAAWPASTLDENPQPSVAELPIHLKRFRPEISPSLMRGYEKLQSGNLEAARRDYEEALKNDPKNVDVHMGLASIAQHQGRGTDAAYHYRRALEVDPTDATAQAAVIGLGADADPMGAESRLKGLLTAQPQSSLLNFTLGNVYSRQNRWREAQQAYFNATLAEGDNPDYLYNLAVSLDHLRQPKLAARHYRLALEAVGRRAAAFDPEQARGRLQDIQPSSEGIPK